jgi:hypothetical protein
MKTRGSAQQQANSAGKERRTMRTTRLASVVAIGAITAMSIAPAVSATPRSGELHITKDCTGYTGLAGQTCTITASNVRAIPDGTRIVYASGVVNGVLDSDMTIEAGPGNVANGHVTLDLSALSGDVELSGGTGKFTHFQASVAVAHAGGDLWTWDGSFDFGNGS